MNATATETTKATHVQVWTGSLCARVTEMVNAGKRGKTCRMLRLTTVGYINNMPGYGEVLHFFNETAEKLAGESYEDIRLLCRALAGVCEGFTFHEETIRGVDAPKLVLTAGVAGKWSASASADGITVSDLRDTINEPKSITPSSQSEAQAYKLAAKVWAKVTEAKTYGQAVDVLPSSCSTGNPRRAKRQAA